MKKTTLINAAGQGYSNLNNVPSISGSIVFTDKVGRIIPVSAETCDNWELINKSAISGCKLVDYLDHSSVIKEY